MKRHILLLTFLILCITISKKGVLEEFITVPNGQHGPITFNDDTYKKMIDFFKKQAGIK